MNRRYLVVSIRAILTILLLVGVYSETGPWTTLALFLTVGAIEVQTYVCGLWIKRYESMSERIDGIRLSQRDET